MSLVRSAALDDPLAIRHAGRELLALALMDTRNALLALVAPLVPPEGDEPVLARRALRAGAWQEHWIAGHVQRARGEAADPAAARLAGVEPRLGAWQRGEEPMARGELQTYLATTLELTLDLLAGTAETDAALYVFRQALRHEDRLVEALAEARRESAPPPRPDRPALLVPASRVRLGTLPVGGFVPETERGELELAVPEFEIDAQPVNWARFAEFADDGGYDRDALWSPEGRAWRDAAARRAPAFVEQLAGGVVLQRGQGRRARLERAPMAQPAMHLSRHEAEAWCRWAGRRLPTEPEWELAATRLARQGFAWGELHEWVAGRARAWPGAGPWPAGALDSPDEHHGVLRGGSWATPPRRRTPAARRFTPLSTDQLATGFRSCAL